MQRFQSPPFNLCAQCGAALNAPIWAKHLDKRYGRNLWSCEACGFQFESTVYLPASEVAGSQIQISGTSVLVH
jgi:ribosomal protein L37AE/L43A